MPQPPTHECEDKPICSCGRVTPAIKTVTLAPAVTETRTPRIGKADDPHNYNRNSWERGIARDEFGLPYLDENLSPVGVKQFAEQRNSGQWDHPGRQVSTPREVGGGD